MKTFNRYCPLLVLSLFFNNLSAQTDTVQGKTAVQWEPDTLFFESMNEGDILLDSFHVTNTGEHPYLIRDVKTSCDCTVLRFPKEPLMPGETATIRVEFDSAGKAGAAQPGIIMYDNSQPNSRSILYLSGYIVSRVKPPRGN